MSFDTDLPSSGCINIEFPSSSYPTMLTVGSNFSVYAPYPNLVKKLISNFILIQSYDY